MHDRRSFAKLIAASALAVPGIAQAQLAAPAKRSQEAEALVRFAEATHPRGAEAARDTRWRALAAEFVAGADGSSYVAYVVSAYRLLSWFHDGHTTVWASALNQGPFGLELPIGAAAFHDGLYVVEAEAHHRDLLGARITSIGSTGIDEVIRQFAAIWPADNRAWIHHDIDLLLATPGLLHGLGVISGADNGSIRLELVTPGGQQIQRDIQPHSPMKTARSSVERRRSERDRWASDAGTGNYVRRLPAQSALYVSLDDLGVKVPTFVAYLRNIFAAMAEPRWDRLILDLRRNSGGNNFLGEPLRKQLGRSRFNRPGGLYVLIGPTTFSAAQNLVNRLERETFAIFAGEPTGGSPRHFGDSRKFDSGKGGLPAFVSTLPWFDSYPQDKRSWMMPDLLFPRTFADWAGGRDPVLDAVLAHRETAAPDELSEDRVFYFNRESQKAKWEPFWMKG